MCVVSLVESVQFSYRSNENNTFPCVNSVETTRVPVVMVRERCDVLMPPPGPGAIALTLAFTSLDRTRCHLSDGGAKLHLNN